MDCLIISIDIRGCITSPYFFKLCFYRVMLDSLPSSTMLLSDIQTNNQLHVFICTVQPKQSVLTMTYNSPVSYPPFVWTNLVLALFGYMYFHLVYRQVSYVLFLILSQFPKDTNAKKVPLIIISHCTAFHGRHNSLFKTKPLAQQLGTESTYMCTYLTAQQ